MTTAYPPCRHRREPRARWAYLCRSPKLAGSRVVAPDVCRACPFADHHRPGDGTEPPPEVRPDMPAERLAELIDGPPLAWPPGWEDWEVTHRAHRLAAANFLARLPDYPAGRFRGRGIVIAGGGPAYFPSLYVSVRAIRHVGCELPIQVWYLGREDELPADRRAVLARFDVECVDADAVRREYPCRILNGWELKVYAVLHAPFEEVLSLDADCYPVRDPSFLFDEPRYRAAGAVFWPDLRDGPPLDCRPFGIAPPARVSVESGQFLIDKRASWRPLQAAWWLNDHSDWSYLHGYGDKHTLEVGWLWCGAPSAMYHQDVEWSVHSFLQAGPDGAALFVHRCKDKFRFGPQSYMNPQPFASNRYHAGLPLETECFGWLKELARELGAPARAQADGRAAVPSIEAFLYTCPERQEVFEGTMARWRETDWGEDPVVLVDDGAGPPSLERHVATARRMLEAAAAHDADYFLFLENDLLFNLHIRHNLAAWPPLRGGWLWMGSLYNPGLTVAPGAPGSDPRRDRFARIAPGGYYGAQAVVLSRAAVATALREWDEPGLLDLKLAGIAGRHCDGIVVHCPSLVQHLGAPSLWGGAHHRAFDYDPLFRAPASSDSAVEHFYETVPGYFDYQDVYRAAVAGAPSPAHFVEVGAWLGRSTAFLAVEVLRSGKAIRLDVVDHWRGSVNEPLLLAAAGESDVQAQFEAHMRRGGVRGAMNVVRKDSVAAAADYADGSLDFVFIDGSHDFASVRRDVLAWLPKVRPGGTLAGHDWGLYEVTPAVTSVLPAGAVRVVGTSWVWTAPAGAGL